MKRFCTSCGSPVEASSRFCAACGAKAVPASNLVEVSALPSARPAPYTAPRQTNPSLPQRASVNVWLIIIVVAFEILGDDLAEDHGVNAVSIVVWTVATLIGLYLISTRNTVNKIVGTVKVLLYVLSITSMIMTTASNHLSGTYSDSTGLATMTFAPNGQVSCSVAGNEAFTGTYEIDGNTLKLIPPGSTDSAPDSKSDPTGSAFYQMFQSALTASISPDRSTIEYAGQELKKQ